MLSTAETAGFWFSLFWPVEVEWPERIFRPHVNAAWRQRLLEDEARREPASRRRAAPRRRALRQFPNPLRGGDPMAEPLHAAIGDNSVDIGMALDFHDRYDAADQGVAEAVAARKDLRAAVKAAGIRLAGFDRARRDRTRSGAEREADNAEYERQMRWLGKPVGTQAGFDFDANDFDLDGIDSEGERAGFAGKRRESNPWTPRTEAADRWG